MTMLAVKVSICQGAFSFAPRDRPLSGPVLSLHSGHPMHTHVAWPFAYLSFLARICPRHHFSSATLEFIERYQRSHGPACLVQRLKALRSKLLKSPAAVVGGGGKKVAKKGSLQKWLVLPYHPVLCRRLLRDAVGKMSDETSCALWAAAHGPQLRPPKLRVSWKQGAPNLAARVARMAMRVFHVCRATAAMDAR